MMRNEYCSLVQSFSKVLEQYSSSICIQQLGKPRHYTYATLVTQHAGSKQIKEAAHKRRDAEH